MKTGLFAACLAWITSLGVAASAQEESAAQDAPPASSPPSPVVKEALRPPEEKSGGKEHADQQFGHGMQLGLRAALTGGYRMIFRYDKSPFCSTPKPATADKDQQKFCGNGAPLALDVALSFGVLDFVEPYAWARFGLKGEASTNTKELVAFGVGARIYTMSDSKLKIFVEPAVGMEVEGGAGNPSWVLQSSNPPGQTPEYKKDFLIHLGVGPQYDFARAFGVYLNAGITTGIVRYVHTQLEISGGVQVRVP